MERTCGWCAWFMDHRDPKAGDEDDREMGYCGQPDVADVNKPYGGQWVWDSHSCGYWEPCSEVERAERALLVAQRDHEP